MLENDDLYEKLSDAKTSLSDAYTELSDIKEVIKEIMTTGDAVEYMDDARVKAIADSVDKRIRYLEQISMTYIQHQTKSTEDDVEESIAEDYSQRIGGL